MMDTAASVRSSRFRQFAVFGLKRSQRFCAAPAWINVERKDASFFSGRDTDIRVFPGFPPPPDFRFIGRGVMHSVFRARMFTGARANRLMALVFATVLAGVLMAWVFANLRTSDSHAGTGSGSISGGSLNRKNGPTRLCIS
jgi:hypothetical protein